MDDTFGNAPDIPIVKNFKGPVENLWETGLGLRRSGSSGGFDRSGLGSSLLTEIEEDETISQATKEELAQSVLNIRKDAGANLSSVFGTISSLKDVRETFLKAQEGIEPKFKARQNTEALFEVLTDQPGRQQTLLSSSNRNNRLLG